MKKFLLLAAAALCLASCCNKPKVESSIPYTIKDGVITFKEQPREPGQQSALQLACDPIDTVRVALIGCGARGGSIFKMINIPTVKVVAFCDLYQDHVDHFQKLFKERRPEDPTPAEYVGAEAYKDLCESEDIDLVYITTGWKLHTPIAVYAMEHGKHVACEVPAAMSLEECWQLVNTCEKTRKHFMMLENCVYDKEELAINNLAQQGLLGEVYYGAGSYIHNLDGNWPGYTDNWRLEFNQEHRGDNYPTHGFGPICRDMNIHRGDKLTTLIAMDTKPLRSAEWTKKLMDTEECAQGDQIITLLNTEKGHLIEIQHNVYGMSPYSRIHEVMGTKGFARKYPELRFNLCREGLPDKEIYNGCEGHGYKETEQYKVKDFVNEVMEDYNHPIHKEIGEMAKKIGGHGGMDFVMQYRLIYCLNHGLPLDMDVYDAAEWSSVVELSAISLKAGNMPVQVPDFTRGDWNKLDKIEFAYAE